MKPKKPTVMISFKDGGQNGGPYNSHLRIKNSKLNEKYNYVPLIFPKGRIGLLNIKILVDLVKQINKEDPDLIHFTGLQLEGFHLALATLITRKKSLLAIHGSSTEAVYFSKLKKIILKLLEKITLIISDGIYGVSNYISEWEMLEQHQSKYYGHVYNLPNFHNKKNELNHLDIRKELNISKDDIVVVSTGRITKEKGYDILKDIIITFYKKYNRKNVKFIIAGEGDYLEEMKKLIANEGYKDLVFFLGYRNDVDSILKVSDIFILSTLHETLSNSILEAGHNGLSTVASKVGGIPEIIRNNYNGFLFEVGNYREAVEYLNTLVENRDLRILLGQNASKNIKNKFTEEIVVEKLNYIYKELLNEN